MGEVRILSESLANRIAAGEVVERPASVVKELVENSLDAHARRIELVLRDGGTKLVEVRDDGVGMSPEDAVLAVQRFATSKIAAEQDLQAITTLGFRGEALPSIGAVAQMKITTRRLEEAEGTALLLEGGEITDMRAVGCPPGTTVQVANLFYNTPARRKFLATTATERGHCLDWVVRMALAHPEVAFQVAHNDAILFNTPGAGDLRSVLAAAYGSTTARQMLPVNWASHDLCIRGYIGSPQLTRATRRHQLFFVNRRFVRSRIMSHALDEAYGMLLGREKQPVAVLMLEIDPEQVDPNVHPTKIEVRFSNQGEIHSLLQQAVAAALAEAGFRSLSQTAGARAGVEASLPAGRLAPVGFDQSGQIKRLRVNPLFDQIDEREEGLGVYEAGEQEGETAAAQPARSAPLVPAPEELAVLGQLDATYLVAQSGQDLLLIDQHRAAERVIFDRLVSQPRRLACQRLAVPATLELTASEVAAVEQYGELLGEMGFELEPFGSQGYLLRAVPAQLTAGSPQETVRDIIAELTEWQHSGQMANLREAMLASIACHAAVKAGQPLSAPEMHKLAEELLAATTPATCPHGDPVIMTMSGSQINRRFRRADRRT